MCPPHIKIYRHIFSQICVFVGCPGCYREGTGIPGAPRSSATLPCILKARMRRKYEGHIGESLHPQCAHAVLGVLPQTKICPRNSGHETFPRLRCYEICAKNPQRGCNNCRRPLQCEGRASERSPSNRSGSPPWETHSHADVCSLDRGNFCMHSGFLFQYPGPTTLLFQHR